MSEIAQRFRNFYSVFSIKILKYTDNSNLIWYLIPIPCVLLLVGYAFWGWSGVFLSLLIPLLIMSFMYYLLPKKIKTALVLSMQPTTEQSSSSGANSEPPVKLSIRTTSAHNDRYRYSPRPEHSRNNESERRETLSGDILTVDIRRNNKDEDDEDLECEDTSTIAERLGSLRGQQKKLLTPSEWSTVTSPGFSSRVIRQARGSSPLSEYNFRGSNTSPFQMSPNGNLRLGEIPFGSKWRVSTRRSPLRLPASESHLLPAFLRNSEPKENGTVYLKIAPIEPTNQFSNSTRGDNSDLDLLNDNPKISAGLGGIPQAELSGKYSRLSASANSSLDKTLRTRSTSSPNSSTFNIIEVLSNRKGKRNRGNDSPSELSRSTRNSPITSNMNMPLDENPKESKRVKFIMPSEPNSSRNLSMLIPLTSHNNPENGSMTAESILEQMNQTEKRFLPDDDTPPSIRPLPKKARSTDRVPHVSSPASASNSAMSSSYRKRRASTTVFSMVEEEARGKAPRFCNCNECYEEAAGVFTQPAQSSQIEKKMDNCSKRIIKAVTCDRSTETEFKSPTTNPRFSRHLPIPISMERYEADKKHRAERLQKMLDVSLTNSTSLVIASTNAATSGSNFTTPASTVGQTLSSPHMGSGTNVSNLGSQQQNVPDFGSSSAIGGQQGTHPVISEDNETAQLNVSSSTTTSGFKLNLTNSTPVTSTITATTSNSAVTTSATATTIGQTFSFPTDPNSPSLKDQQKNVPTFGNSTAFGAFPTISSTSTSGSSVTTSATAFGQTVSSPHKETKLPNFGDQQQNVPGFTGSADSGSQQTTILTSGTSVNLEKNVSSQQTPSGFKFNQTNSTPTITSTNPTSSNSVVTPSASLFTFGQTQIVSSASTGAKLPGSQEQHVPTFGGSALFGGQQNSPILTNVGAFGNSQQNLVYPVPTAEFGFNQTSSTPVTSTTTATTAYVAVTPSSDVQTLSQNTDPKLPIFGSQQSTPLFGSGSPTLGGQRSTPPSFGSFGNSQQNLSSSTSSTGFGFNTNSTPIISSTTATTSNSVVTTPASTFTFGQPVSSTNTDSKLPSYSAQQQNTPSFGSFGAQQSTPTLTSGTFGNPQQNTSIPTTPSGFRFNQPNSNPVMPPTPATTSSSYVTTPARSVGFSAPQTDAKLSIFGGQQQNAPAFGSSAIFGGQPSTSLTSGGFGNPQQNVSNSTSSSGFGFNQSTSTSAISSPTTTTPNNVGTTPGTAFGQTFSSPIMGSLFGSQPNVPTFGSSAVFGSQQNTPSLTSGVFGNPQQNVTSTTASSGFGFNQTSSTPIISSTPATTASSGITSPASTFTFGQTASSPNTGANVSMFGNQQQTFGGSAVFGGQQNTPSLTSGVFGNPQQNVTSTAASSGFGFNQSSGGAGTGAFAFGAQQPAAGPTGAFAFGSANSAAVSPNNANNSAGLFQFGQPTQQQQNPGGFQFGGSNPGGIPPPAANMFSLGASTMPRRRDARPRRYR